MFWSSRWLVLVTLIVDGGEPCDLRSALAAARHPAEGGWGSADLLRRYYGTLGTAALKRSATTLAKYGLTRNNSRGREIVSPSRLGLSRNILSAR